MGGDKIVLLDGAGANGGGAAANGLLSMIPGMFANLIGGNKMDPNLVAALMNGRNNQDGFGGANGWWLWIIVLFWLWGGRGFGNGFGNGGDCCANGLPAQLNNDYGRELLMQAIQGNRSAIDQIASALNCSTTQLQNAICNVQGAIDKVAGQVGMTSQAVINAVQQQGCEIGNQISSCCCNLSSLVNYARRPSRPTPLVLLTRLILGDRYSEEVAAITDVDVTTDVAITTLLSDFIKRGG